MKPLSFFTPIVCNRPLGLRDGSIDLSQIVYTSRSDSGQDGCRALHAGRMDSSSWCTTLTSNGKESVLIRFHNIMILTGVLFKFQSDHHPTSYKLKYLSTDTEDLSWLQDLTARKDGTSSEVSS